MENRGTIVLIEDEDAIADLLRLYCEQEGYRLVHAPNGERGIAAVRDRDPRVVLLDIDSGKSETLASGTIDPSGSCNGTRLLRLYPRIADVNRDKHPDIVVEREELACDKDTATRRQENFLADGTGYRRQ